MKSTVADKLTEVASRVFAQGRRYGRTFSWLIGDSMRADPKLWRWMFIATWIGLGANAAVVGLIFGYVMLVEGNEQILVLGLSIDPRESFLLLTLAVAALLAVSLALAAAQYVAGTSAVRAMGSSAKRCSLRAINLYRFLPDPRAYRADEILQRRTIVQLVRANANQCGLAIRMIGSSVQSLLILLFAVGIMFLLDAKTTLIVCGLGMLVVVIQYPSNLFAAASTSVVERTLPGVLKELVSVVDRVSSKPRHAQAEELARDVAACFEKPVIRHHYSATENRFRAIEVSGLTMRLGTAVILVGVIMTFGAAVLRHEVEWAKLLAYLTLLRLALQSVTAVFQTVTGVTRLYPGIQEYADFVASASLAKLPLPVESKSSGPDTLVLRLPRRDSDRDSDDAELKLKRGARCAFMAPPKYGRELAVDFQRALGFRRGEFDPAPMLTVDIAFELPSPGEAEPFSGQCNELEGALRRLSDRGTDVILLDRRAVEVMGSAKWDLWSERFRNSVLIMTYSDRTAPVADLGEQILFLKPNKFCDLRWMCIPTDGLSEQEVLQLWSGTTAAMNTAKEGEDADLVEE